MLGDKGVEAFFTSHRISSSAELTTALGTTSEFDINDDITVVVADV
jgi:hypothetical protein